MSQYYCTECYNLLGLVSPPNPVTLNLTGTPYQLEKFLKHTISTGTHGNSFLFSDPSYLKYRDYFVTGTLAGYLEIDDKSRKNLIWYAGKETGLKYEDGKFVAPTTGVKIVLLQNTKYIHAFPIQGYSGTVVSCQNCGRDIPQW